MKKRIAILTQKGSLSRGLQDNTTVNLFTVEDEAVVEVENLALENTSENYFSLLMSLKKVSLIYVDSISSDFRKVLEKIGIITKCREDISDDTFISRFVFA